MQRPARRAGKVGLVTLSDPADQTDERLLVERAKAGDRKALGTLLSNHGPRLYRAVLLPRLGNEARARDALSATYERAIQRLHQYEWQPCGVYPWLRVVALRIALDMLRSGRRELLYDTEDVNREIEAAEVQLSNAMPSVEALHERDELDAARAKLRDALAQINPRYATAIRLRILEDRPREEVAKQMGVTPATFDVLLHRSMASLKKVMGSRGTEGSEP
ncbi:MAG: sigma-70 family RNA polymerase sigma factor [Deltaproteobacteria bacterium HGW-Deltaproteobacteria-20]|jgi:RNA polymerase sigma-70 factor (ECF subfamily)|nr:MAG: sigma-70 family RNA polymerase sigma factor [Deltaproteobacteria bacterium HGW-Deltaproteobacteria-20]